MESITALIVDDERPAREVLKVLLKTYCPEVEIVAEAISVASAIEAIKTKTPDIVFLDIDLQAGGFGFDVLKAFANPDFGVIFVSGYNEYAAQAFRFSAIDFLGKPVVKADLQEAVAKAMRERETKENSSRMDALLSNVRELNTDKKRIFIRDINGHQVVYFKDILYFKADSNYCKLYLADEQVITSTKPLKHYSNVFEGTDIYRVHNSFLVNLTQVKKVSNKYYLIMSDGTKIEYARNKKEVIMDYFNRLG